MPDVNYVTPARFWLMFGPWGLPFGVQGFTLGPLGFLDANSLVSGMQNAYIGGLTGTHSHYDGTYV